ncbi:MAG: PrsW family intramembrane metalloprotease [Anaerolineae bacterium]|nr:PrsW family intramembrane metalloprotease [Anaerolineae bacterium]
MKGAVAALPWTARISLLLLLAVIIVLNACGRRHLPDHPFDRAILLRAAGMPARAESALEQAVMAWPLDLEINRLYVINHYETPPGAGRDDRALEGRYLALTADPASADMAHLCLGEIRSLQNRHPEALELYLRVRNPRLRYLNSGLARTYYALGDAARAEAHYRLEIALGGDLASAVPELARLYLAQGRLDQVSELLADDRLARYLNAGIRREAALRLGDWGAYARIVFLEPVLYVQLGAALSALVICGIWLTFFRRIDVFEQEPLALVLLALVLGALSAEGSLVLGDALEPVLRPRLPAGWPGDLVHSVIGTGIVEEVAKFVPLLLVAALSRHDNEPIDLLIYGSLSALGFATLENALYFTGYGLDIVFSRFIISTVLHLSMTGSVAYAWGRAQFIRRAWPAPRVASALVLAALLHGLFNYFLGRPPQQLAAVSILIGLGLAIAYGNMIVNCLNFSPYFRRSQAQGSRLQNLGLLAGTAALLISIGYLYSHYTYSTEVANLKLLSGGASALLSVLVVFGSLGEITLMQGTTVPLLQAAWRRRRTSMER